MSKIADIIVDALPLAVGHHRPQIVKVIDRYIIDHARLLDLVRSARGELHHEGLITDEEYAALVQVGNDESTERLASYDEVQAECDKKLLEQKAEIARLKHFIAEGVMAVAERGNAGPFNLGSWVDAAKRETFDSHSAPQATAVAVYLYLQECSAAERWPDHNVLARIVAEHFAPVLPTERRGIFFEGGDESIQQVRYYTSGNVFVLRMADSDKGPSPVWVWERQNDATPA